MDRRGPVSDVSGVHGTARLETSVFVAPTTDVHEVLLARQQGAAAQMFVLSRSRDLALEAVEQVGQHPSGNFGPLRGVNKAEQNEMAEQHPPVGIEAAQHAAPIEAGCAGMEQVVDIGAIIAFTFYDE